MEAYRSLKNRACWRDGVERMGWLELYNPVVVSDAGDGEVHITLLDKYCISVDKDRKCVALERSLRNGEWGQVAGPVPAGLRAFLKMTCFQRGADIDELCLRMLEEACKEALRTTRWGREVHMPPGFHAPGEEGDPFPNDQKDPLMPRRMAEAMAGLHQDPHRICDIRVPLSKLRRQVRAAVRVWWRRALPRDLSASIFSGEWRLSKWELGGVGVLMQRPTSARRVAAERPNLVPLLLPIRPEKWRRLDLFAKRHWVRDGKPLPCDEPNFWTEWGASFSFDEARSFNWVTRAVPEVVGAWVDAGASSKLAKAMSLAQVGKTSDQRVVVSMLQGSRRLAECVPEDDIGRMYRLFAGHCEWVRAEAGDRAVVNMLHNEEFKRAADYVAAYTELFMRNRWTMETVRVAGMEPPGVAANATWLSITRRSDRWHELMARDQAQTTSGKKGREQMKMFWKSAIGEVEIDGWKFVALCSDSDLKKEGKVMDHCVASYDVSCMGGKYRVFTATKWVPGEERERYTAGIAMTSARTWKAEQVRGVGDSLGTDEVVEATHKLALAYTRAEQEVTMRKAA